MNYIFVKNKIYLLSLKDHDTKKDLIQALAKHLKSYRKIHTIVPILTAKVPIVKFTHAGLDVEGDISMENTLVSSFKYVFST